MAHSLERLEILYWPTCSVGRRTEIGFERLGSLTYLLRILMVVLLATSQLLI